MAPQKNPKGDPVPNRKVSGIPSSFFRDARNCPNDIDMGVCLIVHVRKFCCVLLLPVGFEGAWSGPKRAESLVVGVMWQPPPPQTTISFWQTRYQTKLAGCHFLLFGCPSLLIFRPVLFTRIKV